MTGEVRSEYEVLSKKIETREARVAIMGMGFVGLPLVVEFVKEGFSVVGVDIDKDRILSLQEGTSYVQDVPDSALKSALASGLFEPTTDFGVLEQADAISICVPTPLRKTKDPDISYILMALDEVCAYLKPPKIVVLESTTYPGTTEEILLPRIQERGLRVGTEVFLAFSPERVDPGNKLYTTKNTPKIVGGVTDRCTKIASKLYGSVMDMVVPVSSARTAEMVKLLENTFRAVNIALVNEVLLMCRVLGIDVWEVIEAVDPHYLSWKLKTLNYRARFIELATEVNQSMPTYVVSRITDALNEEGKALRGSTILVIGVAYKRDVGDVRESPALDIFQLLFQKGATILFNDPYMKTCPLADLPARYVELTPEVLNKSDCAVIVTDHTVYDYHFLAKNTPLLLDTRNATKDVPRGVGRVVRL
jgi:UDP-N-acetyl-D-glucosamine dehydrogenase